MNQTSTQAAKRKSHRSLGMEITDRTLKLCEVREGGRKGTKVIRYMSADLPQDVLRDGRIHHKPALKDAIDEMLKQSRTKAKQIHISVPSSLVMARILQLPDISPKELRRVVQYEMRNNLKVAFDNPYYDFVKLPKAQSEEEAVEESAPELLDEMNNSAMEVASAQERMVNVLVVAAPKSELVQYSEVLEALGLQPRSIEISALAVLRLFEQMSLARFGLHMFVQVGKYGSEITIFEDGIFRMNRSLEVEFVQTESSASVNEGVADWLEGFTDPNRQFNQAVRELISEIERIMDFYYYTIVNQRGQLFKKIWVAGDVEQLDTIIEQMQQQYSVEVTVLKEGSEKLLGSKSDWKISEFAVPLGLALRGGER